MSLGDFVFDWLWLAHSPPPHTHTVLLLPWTDFIAYDSFYSRNHVCISLPSQIVNWVPWACVREFGSNKGTCSCTKEIDRLAGDYSDTNNSRMVSEADSQIIDHCSASTHPPYRQPLNHRLDAVGSVRLPWTGRINSNSTMKSERVWHMSNVKSWNRSQSSRHLSIIFQSFN